MSLSLGVLAIALPWAVVDAVNLRETVDVAVVVFLLPILLVVIVLVVVLLGRRQGCVYQQLSIFKGRTPAFRHKFSIHSLKCTRTTLTMCRRMRTPSSNLLVSSSATTQESM